MKCAVCLGVLVLIASDCAAQRRVLSDGAPRGNIGAGLVRPRPFGGMNPVFPGYVGDYYPWSDYCCANDFDYPPYPPVGPPPIVVHQPPPLPVIPVIHEYNFGIAASPGSEPSTFVIATRDGSRLAANAVWVQNGVLHYFDAGDRAHQLPLASIDRDLTRKLNQERNLNLRLPAE